MVVFYVMFLSALFWLLSNLYNFHSDFTKLYKFDLIYSDCFFERVLKTKYIRIDMIIIIPKFS